MYVRPRPRFRPRNAGSGNTPSLALEFNQLSALPSYVTFSRGTQAMQYGSDGTLQYAPNNLLTYSNQADNAAWTKSNSFVQTNLLLQSQTLDNATWGKQDVTVTANAILAPDGTLTADKISENAITGTHEIFQSVVASATTYTASEYFKAAERTEVALYFVTAGSTAGAKAVADLSAGTVAVTNFGATTGSTATITAIPNYPGWYRVTLTVLATAATYFYDTMPSVAGSQNYAGTAGFGIYAWGAQLVQGSVPGDYRATTSAALPVLYSDYNGALRARKLCETTAVTTQHAAISASLGVPAAAVTLSVRAKAGERTLMGLYANTIGKGQYFNLANGTVGAVLVSAPYSASITPLQNGWYLCTVTVIAGSNEGLSVYLTDNSTITYTGDGSSGIYIADAQLTPGYLPLAVTETTSAAVYGPRFDYDPVTKIARGLLIEEQRTNLLLQSNDFFTSWTPVNITRTPNATLSPEGVVNGVKIEATAAAATSILQTVTVAATSATFSVYVKQGTGATTANNFGLRNVTTLTNLVFGTLNYSTGVFTYTVGSSGVVVTNVGNGWWRIAITATTGITAGDLCTGYVGFIGNAQAAGDFLYAYGAQMEVGAFASTYMPTVTSTATRNADSASITTLTPWFNAATSTLYAEGITNAPVDTNVRNIVSINDGTTANMHRVFSYNGKIGASTVVASVNSSDLQPLTYMSGAIFKSAYAFAVNDFAMTANGLTPFTDTLGPLPSGLTTLSVGGPSIVWGFWVRSIRYYPTRLPNATLQSITA